MRKDNKGMTLIELLVAIAMLGVVISPFLKTFTISARQNNKARETFRATTVAQNLMEGLEAFSLEDVCNQVNKNTGNASMLYRPNGYAEHREIGEEKSGNGLSGNEYVFQNTPSNKYEIGIKGIEEDGKLYDAKILLDASVSEYSELNSDNDFYINKMDESLDLIFSLSQQDEMEKLGNNINWSNVGRKFTINLKKIPGSGNTEVQVKVDYTSISVPYSTVVGKEITRTFSNINNVYIMYYPNYGGPTDEFVVDYNSDDEFNLCLIKQKFDTAQDDSSYMSSISILDYNTDEKPRITLRTNIPDNLYNPADANAPYATAMNYEYKINNVAKDFSSLLMFEDDIPQSLVGTISNQNAIYKTNVQVYEYGSYDNGFADAEPIAQLAN